MPPGSGLVVYGLLALISVTDRRPIRLSVVIRSAGASRN